MSTPTIGRIVLYKIHARDAEAINRRRRDYEAYRREPATDLPDGRQFHVGNEVREGDCYPAIVVRTFGFPSGCSPTDSANLKVLLDGSDDFWATSRAEGEGPGFWAWPTRG